MSSTKYAAPLVLRPEWPWRLSTVVAGTYAGALLLVLWAPLPLPVALAAVLWLTLWGGFGVRRFLGRDRIVEAVWKENDEWDLRQRSGRASTAWLAPDTFFRPGLIVLNFRATPPVPSLVLFGNEPDGRTHRRLRVRLRLHQAQMEEDDGGSALQRLARRLRSRSSWQE